MKPSKELIGPTLQNCEIPPSIQHVGSSALTLIESCERRAACLRGSIFGEGENGEDGKFPHPTHLEGIVSEINRRIERLDAQLSRLMAGVNGEA